MSYDRPERHNGAIGAVFIIEADTLEYSNSRSGSDQPLLEVGDVIIRLHYSGDCFADYQAFRDGKELGDKGWRGYWRGYDGAGRYLFTMQAQAVGGHG